MNAAANTEQCPNCRQDNPRTRTHCDFCGKRLPWATPQPNTATAPNVTAPPANAATSAVRSPSRSQLVFGAALLLVLSVAGASALKSFTSSQTDLPVTPPPTITTGQNPSNLPPSTAGTGQPDVSAPIAETQNPEPPVINTPAKTYTVTFRVTGEIGYNPGLASVVGDPPDRYVPGKGMKVGPPPSAVIYTTPQINEASPSPAETSSRRPIKRLPWSATFTTENAHLSLFASNQGSEFGNANEGGRLIAEILVDGQRIASDRMLSGVSGTVKCEAGVGEDPRSPETIKAASLQKRRERIAQLREEIAALEHRRSAILSRTEGSAATREDAAGLLDDKIKEKQEQIDRLLTQ